MTKVQTFIGYINNSIFTFGPNSIKQLLTCHKDLQLIMTEAIKYTMVDFGITEGTRTVERQQELYKQGLSQVDGIKIKGKHNFEPSLACDIVTSVKGKEYDLSQLCYLAGVITCIANKLYSEGRIAHNIRWGGNWNSDSEIVTNQNFIDSPHFELV